MSYDSTSGPRRKGGGGMFFLIILAIGGFLIFSRMGGGGADPAETPQQGSQESTGPSYVEDDSQYQTDRKDILGSKAMPTTGGTGAAAGWSAGDVNTTQNSNDFQGKTTGVLLDIENPKNSKTQNGDWSGEDVNATEKKTGNQFKFSNEPGSVKPTNSKTQNGDWSSEEVDPGKK